MTQNKLYNTTLNPASNKLRTNKIKLGLNPAGKNKTYKERNFTFTFNYKKLQLQFTNQRSAS